MRNEGAPCVRIKNFQYASFHSTRPRMQSQRNPIKIVIDKIGADGMLQQHVVNQSDDLYLEREREKKIALSPKPFHHQSVRTLRPPPAPQMARSHVFNRFQYDNYQQFPTDRQFRTQARKPRGPNHKNIEVVFCQNKFPQFVGRTNQKIEDIFKKEQLQAHEDNRRFMATHASKEKIITRRPARTSLAVCLKEFGTLEKLSMFMETDQNMREKWLHLGIERDPSRTLLLDVLNHRFAFMKQMGRRLRDWIYRCLLKRDDLHPLSKLNLQEYMAFYEMLVGRDANIVDTATFIYLLLFHETPSFSSAKAVIEQTNGPIHKQRAALDTIFAMIQQREDELVTAIAKNEPFMRLIIDLIVEK